MARVLIYTSTAVVWPSLPSTVSTLPGTGVKAETAEGALLGGRRLELVADIRWHCYLIKADHIRDPQPSVL